jgi:hypothetical protein
MTVGSKYHHALKKAARLGFYSRVMEADKLPFQWKQIIFSSRRNQPKLEVHFHLRTWLRMHEIIPGDTMIILLSCHRFLKSSDHLIALKDQLVKPV